MLKCFASILVIVALTGPAKAEDACDALVALMENYMSNAKQSPLPMSEVERLLEAARAAKQAGNVKACESAMSSPAPADPGGSGRSCKKTPNTV